MTAKLDIARLDSGQADFWDRMRALVAWDEDTGGEVETIVQAIVSDVRSRGDAAVIEHTNRFDHRAVESVAELSVAPERLEAALGRIGASLREALETAARRIRAFHDRQKEASWLCREDPGVPGLHPVGAGRAAAGAGQTVLGQKVTPLERVGLYVPGGTAAYPSTVLMNAIPAQVAGVPEIVMVVPAPEGALNEAVLAAAGLAGVTRVYTVGGAQAVAALAYGTESFAAVDKIVGPGNVYVATAKRLVFGRVGIDMVAGPSEILVIGDGSTPPGWIAADLLSQAEHDEQARAMLVATDASYLDAVAGAIDRLLPAMDRAGTIAASLGRHGALVRVASLEEAARVANFVAPEHLELSVERPHRLLPCIHHAGAVFLGRYACEVLGDYCAGPNHVLPTGRTARFSSPLGVYDFQKRTSIIDCSAESAAQLGRVAVVLARAEGLGAHARAAELRGGRARAGPARTG